MDKTPNTRSMKLSCNRIPKHSEPNESVFGLSQLGPNACSTSTPIVQRIPDSDIEESPGYYPCTQEEFENLDVVWDWNSPQGKQKKRKKQKKLILTHSPKLPLRRHPSNNNIKNFEKLKEELKALREEIAVPDNEACLVLSPLEEVEFKKTPSNCNNNESAIESLIQENQVVVCDSELEDLFNDSADEDLCFFTQQLEQNLEGIQQASKVTPVKQQININKNVNSVKRVLNLETQKPTKADTSCSLADDSFDVAMQHIEDEKIEELTQVFNQSQAMNTNFEKTSNSFQRTKSDVQYNSSSSVVGGKQEFQRTQSFELANMRKGICELPKSTQEEIERKRLQALAKLQAKKRQGSTESINSPIKCSPEEIEQKRLQALAKLEAKRQQEIIERNRQEALRKLEMNRKKKFSK